MVVVLDFGIKENSRLLKLLNKLECRFIVSKNEKDIITRGYEKIQEIVSYIKDRFCKKYRQLSKTGLLDEKSNLFVLLVSIILEVRDDIKIAYMVAGYLANQGAKYICE